MKKVIFGLAIMAFILFLSFQVNADIDLSIDLEDFQVEGKVKTEFEVGTDPDKINFVKDLKLYSNSDEGFVEGKILVEYTKSDFSRIGKTEIRLYVLYNDGIPKYIGKPIEVNIIDTTKPTLVGVKPLEIQLYQVIDYKAGVTAFDNDTSSPLDIKVFSQGVDITKEGIYTISYYVVDRSGNERYTTTNVYVQKKDVDPSKPKITVNQKVFNIHENDPNPGKIYLNSVTAKDGEVDIFQYIQFDDSGVDYSKVSTVLCTENDDKCENNVIFMVFDADGNFTSVKVPVNIINDITNPYFKNLDSSIDFNVQVKKLTEAEIKKNLSKGIVALDDICGDVSNRIEITLGDDFKHDVKGKYDVTFTVSDLNGNQISQVVSVNVVDIEPPIITAPKDLYLKINGILDLASKITVTDNYDRDVDYVLDDNNLNSSKVGTYIISISASDDDNNKSTHKITVFVYSSEPAKLSENPIIVGIVVSIIVSGLVIFTGYLSNKNKRRKSRI